MIRHSLPHNKTGLGYWYVVSQGKLFLPNDSELPRPQTLQQLELALDGTEMLCQIGEIDQLPCYLLQYQDRPEPEDHWHSARQFLMYGEQHFEHAARACQVALFLQTHKFCGQCGSSMHLVNWELAALCHKCGHRCYPRINPCVLIAVVNSQHQLLLARSARHKTGFFSILAGFVESAETLEQAAIREVAEEVGVVITNLRYAGSQPWPFPHSLMTAFIADYQSGELRCQPEEIEEAHWFDLDKLPDVPGEVTLSGQIIQQLVNANCRK
ncbi:NAD(+) diphosphatase [Rheinheimera marina]|uniref:NAD(+) diphosphatase n=1 Tax=Rheinheimera marina TaxID=1774958 RepID=A0ABV9JGJ2_9GAMM